MISFLTSLTGFWLAATVVFCALLLIRTTYMLIATPVIRVFDSVSGDSSNVSILLPVRNEAARVLRQNLESLISQTHAWLQIIAVDDSSTDDSLSILHEYARLPNSRLRVIQGQEVPIDWLGKLFALHQAKALSRGEWLLVVDADVVYLPHSLTGALAFARENRLDAVSLLPRLELRTFWEAVVIPAMAWPSLIRVSTTQANRQRSKMCFGNGNFILMRRSAHDAIGGFKSYRRNILDDCATMERLKLAGYRVMVADGSRLMSSRMYSSFREILEGFGKNAFAALHFSILRVTGVLLMEILFVLLPPIYLFHEILTPRTLMSPGMQVSGLAVTFFFLTMLCFGLRMRAGLRFFIFYLLGHMIALAIVTYSMLTSKAKWGSSWKGRLINRTDDYKF